MKVVGVLVGLVLAIIVGAITLSVAYSDAPEATSPGLQSLE
jgi:hypothetical protein